MTTYLGTQDVDPGLYLSLKRFRMETIDTRAPLPGVAGERYCRIPIVVMLAAAPLLGLAFVIFLPLIGFAMVAWLLGNKIAELAARTAAQIVRVARPGWAPSMAFLSRFTPVERGNTETTPDAWTKEVEKKLNETNIDAR